MGWERVGWPENPQRETQRLNLSGKDEEWSSSTSAQVCGASALRYEMGGICISSLGRRCISCLFDVGSLKYFTVPCRRRRTVEMRKCWQWFT